MIPWFSLNDDAFEDVIRYVAAILSSLNMSSLSLWWLPPTFTRNFFYWHLSIPDYLHHHQSLNGGLANFLVDALVKLVSFH